MLGALSLSHKCLTRLPFLRTGICEGRRRALGRPYLLVSNLSETSLAERPLAAPKTHSNPGTPLAVDRPLLVIGIDPDCSGALAVVRVRSLPQADAQVIDDVAVTLHDNPCEILETKARKRRQADSAGIARIVRELAADHGTEGARVVMEYPQPNSLNGKQSWYACGYSYGVWHGALACHGIQPERVSCRRWKTDLQLNGKGKEGSRLLALRLFPTATDLLKRKKDHGRAEAMLIAAWALGLRILPETDKVKVVPPEEGSKDAVVLDELLDEDVEEAG